MADATTIASLELEITSNSKEACKGLDALSNSLKKLQQATSKGLGLTAIVNEIKAAGSVNPSSLDGLTATMEKLSQLKGLKFPSLKNLGLTSITSAITSASAKVNANSLDGLVTAVKRLDELKDVKIPASIGTQLTAIVKAIDSIKTDGGAKIETLVGALNKFSQLEKSNLSSYVTNLKKLPEVFASLKTLDIAALETKIKEVAAALKPLGDEMQKIANGFSSFPAKLQKLIAGTDNLTRSNGRASTSYVNLYAKLRMAKSAVTGIGRTIGKWITLASSYTETMNLFTVSMGSYAKDAYDYAQTVEKAMGIDPAEWMNNQAIFMSLGKGFGMAGDKANTMSQQLTQLGYDLSSFFNIKVEDAMLKLQSGIAGELEPLRRLGYDLSNAKLEAVALSLGIDKTVSSMTQAEKAELRYYAIMTQVTDAHGDMAHTLNAPANQLRILKSQVTQLGRALGNFFIPILNKVLPYAIASVKVLREVLDVFMDLIGIELSAVDFGADSITSATDEVTSNLEDAQDEAKKLKSYMLGFDELNVINADDASDALDSGLNIDMPTYDFMDGIVSTQFNEITEKMKEWLGITEEIDTWSELMDTRFGNMLKTVGLIGSGIAAWKITKALSNFLTKDLPALSKLVKTKSFQLTLGITLAIAGLTMGASVIMDAITNGLESVDVSDLVTSAGLIIAGGTLIGKTFGAAMTGAAVSAIVLGVAGLGVALYDAIKNELDITNGLTIAFTAGLIGAGVGYLINGALGAAVGAMAGVVIGGAAAGAIWIIQNVEDTVDKVFGIVSAAALAVGAILAFTGANIPLGIGLMAGGALGMGQVISMNMDALSGDVKDVIAVITGIVSVGLLALGAVFAFSGANIPLGIGLMLGGAVSLGTSVALNWDTLVNAIQGTVGKIMAIAGAAAMVIGLILLFTGVGTGLGLGLLLGGAASLGTAIAFNWNSIVDAIKGVWTTITSWWRSTVAPIFTKEYWAKQAEYIGQGLVNGWNNFWAKIKEWWNGLIDKIKDILGIHSPSTVFAEIGGFLIQGLLNGLKSAFNSVITWFNTNLITPIANAFSGIWTTMKNGAISAWDGVKSVFSSVAKFFKDTFSNAWQGIVSIFSYAGNVFVNIRDGIVSVFKTIVNGLITGINNVVAIPFNAINTALTTIRNVNILGVTPFTWIKTISVPKIPLLAEGGMVNSGQLFVAREAGAELVGNIGGRTAVMNNDQIVESVSAGVYQAVLAALGSNNDDGGNTNIVITLDGEKIYENQQKIARGRGYNMGMGAFSFG